MRFLQYGVEHRREIAGRGIDDLQYLGGPVATVASPSTVATAVLDLLGLDHTITPDEHPDIVARLLKYAEAARDDLGDTATKREGNGVREPGRLPPEK